MKKSKILAPALALTIFSTAAAVTGTVAWYFAQRAVSVQSTVTSFNPEAGLKVTVAAGVGTTAVTGYEESTNANSPAQITHELIRDGSVDLANQKAYGAVKNRAGNQIISFKEIDAVAHEGDLLAGTNAEDKDFYYATKCTATFELTKKNTGVEYALFYDNSLLKVDADHPSTIQESLRVGFVIGSGTSMKYFVVAPYRDEAPAEGIKYVKNTDKDQARGDYDASGKVLYGYKTTITDNSGTYSAATSGTPVNNLTDGATPTPAALEGSVTEARANEILGFMGKIKNAETITATVYTWFEGEDPHSASEYVDNKQTQTTLGFSLLEIEA